MGYFAFGFACLGMALALRGKKIPAYTCGFIGAMFALAMVLTAS